jgi:hypothetical protein
LSYRIDPNQILPKLLRIQSVDPGVIHIFMAIMGLYLAAIILWLLGAIRGGPLVRTALIGEIVFMDCFDDDTHYTGPCPRSPLPRWASRSPSSHSLLKLFANISCFLLFDAYNTLNMVYVLPRLAISEA